MILIKAVFENNIQETYPDMGGPLPAICNLEDIHNHSLQLCSDRSECNDTCDFHLGTHQYLEKYVVNGDI